MATGDLPPEQYVLPPLHLYTIAPVKETAEVQFDKQLLSVFRQSRAPFVDDLLQLLTNQRARAVDALGCSNGKTAAPPGDALRETRLYVSLLLGLLQQVQLPEEAVDEGKKKSRVRRFLACGKASDVDDGAVRVVAPIRLPPRSAEPHSASSTTSPPPLNPAAAAPAPGATVAADGSGAPPLSVDVSGVDTQFPYLTGRAPTPTVPEHLAGAHTTPSTSSSPAPVNVMEQAMTAPHVSASLRHVVEFRWSNLLLAADKSRAATADALFELYSMLLSLGINHLNGAAALGAQLQPERLNDADTDRVLREMHATAVAAAGLFQALMQPLPASLTLDDSMPVGNDLANFAGAPEIADGRQAPHLAQICEQQALAAAQELTVRRALKARNVSVALLAKIAMDTSQRYARAATEADSTGNALPRKWRQYLAFKQPLLEAWAWYLWALHLDSLRLAERNAEAIACMEQAVALLDAAAQQLTDYRKDPQLRAQLADARASFVAKLQALQHDNDTIYHERIPPLAQLAEQPTAKAAAEPARFVMPEMSDRWTARVYAEISPIKLNRELRRPRYQKDSCALL